MFAKLNGYFGLDTTSDRTWFYGVFGVGGSLYAIDMFIAYVL
ncbi:DUF3961 domain-containing protein [Bacillus clarus]|uniref:DUF3961 domain-containing protein n=1 Tax=Bacillus clarus TaxID=2338372 RepID=A0A090YTP0_9BACI|nr:DUF3961 domain-containing protein [Bacillus clarus]KFN01343.1 putative membrane protein [Bacillus clarus]RFT63467.1 DUF3961 domain-containing protein [Bacillus clarus]